VYRSLRACLSDLEQKSDLIRVSFPVDPALEMAEIHRRVFESGGPAIHFTQLRGNRFEAASNLYGNRSRVDYLFRQALPLLRKLGALRSDPSILFKKPLEYMGPAVKARYALPKKTARNLVFECTISELPSITSWPLDGGPFVLLPQVFSLPPGVSNLMKGNLGMYRVQLQGNDYKTNEEIGLHYQLHRGIGNHHRAYLESDQPFKVSIFIGGPPAHALSAIFPLPEDLSELTFAGLLNQNRFRYSWVDDFLISEQADFVITGEVVKNQTKPEGPFGDHLGYYSLQHPFPYVRVHKVFHRREPIWHFTVVGRPPQEDSYFGYLIHQVVKDLVPKEFPGLVAMHAVDVAGVHPLLLAIGKERYMPFREKRPEEILTIANRILGSGQTSLAKFLFIAAHDPEHHLDIHDFPSFFTYFLERIRFDRDLHFYTNTTIDTLDYSGDGWNMGSKLVLACHGDPIRTLSNHLPPAIQFPPTWQYPVFISSGILCIQIPPYQNTVIETNNISLWINELESFDWNGIVLLVLCDDSRFTAANWNNFLWVSFTRSNPAQDVHGLQSRFESKHYACEPPLILDARIKPHHAPVLQPDPTVSAKVDKYFSKGGPLYGMNKRSKATY
jgi:4-hydroxy-3-polyprenylbenzoate decarboxylase